MLAINTQDRLESISTVAYLSSVQENNRVAASSADAELGDLRCLLRDKNKRQNRSR